MAATYRVEALANYHCAVGENPLWDEALQVLYWTDIPQGRLFRYEARTGRHEQFYAGAPVGGFTLQAEGSLLLFGENQISLLRKDGAVQLIKKDIYEAGLRFNDVIATPNGTVFAGTYTADHKNLAAGLYHVALDGAVQELFRGTACSNGMGFSPDKQKFYWTDSTARKIFAFDYDINTDAITNRRQLVAVSDAGTPDGLTVDAEGNLWSARWDGGAVYKYSPSGRPLDKIELPVAKVSSVSFGGPNMEELYITTAGGKAGAESADGSLYRVKINARGLPEFRSRVML